MSVLEKTDTFSRPDNNVVISAAGSPALSIFTISEAVHDVFVCAFLVNHFSIHRVVDEDAVARGNEDLFAV